MEDGKNIRMIQENRRKHNKNNKNNRRKDGKEN